MLAPVSVDSLQENSGTFFSLNCSSSGSPPTNVTWTKDGDVVAYSENFTTIQYLRDGVMAKYDNALVSFTLEPSEVVGTYVCSIENSVSAPSEATLTIQGMSNNIIVACMILSLTF